MMTSFQPFARLLTGLALGCGIALANAIVVPAQAQGQARPTRIVVPFAVGGASDTYTRLVAQKVTEQTGKTIVVENRTGAGGRISFDYVAKSAPDGATVALIDATYAMLPGLFPVLPWDINSDLIPVVMIAQTPFILVVRADGPFKTFDDLIAYARANPGKLNYGSAGVGSVNHIVTERFRSDAKIDITHIPYKGGAPAASAVMAGEIDMVFGEPATLLPFVESGKLRAIATTGAKRSLGMPDLPTIAESGVPGYDVTSWNGVLAPAGTPANVIARLNAAFNKVLADPEMRSRLLKIGYEPVGGPPERFSQKIENETRKWGPVIKEAGLQMN